MSFIGNAPNVLGPQGYQGFQGPQGYQGYQGPQGYQGYQGDSGITSVDYHPGNSSLEITTTTGSFSQTINQGNSTTTGLLSIVDSVSNTSDTVAASANSVATAWQAAQGAYSSAVGYVNTLANNYTDFVNNTFATIVNTTVTGVLTAEDVVITGNLTVSGNVTYIESQTLNIGDNVIVLNADIGENAPTEDAGVEVDRGTSNNVSIKWNEAADEWQLTNDGDVFEKVATNNDVSTAYSDATTFASNADNITSGTLDTARLPATANISTAVNVGANVNLSTSQISVGNSTVNVSISSTTIAVGDQTITSNSEGFDLSGNKLYVSGIAIGNTVIANGSFDTSLPFAVTNTFAAGNTTITGFANVTGSVTADSFSGDGTAVTNVNAATVGGNTASDLQTYADNKAANAYSNATSYADTVAGDAYANATSYADDVAANAYSNATAFAANADNISSGTLNTSRLPSQVLVSTSITVGNSTVNTQISDTGVVATNLSGNGAGVTSVDAVTLGGNTVTDILSYASNTADQAYANAVDYADDVYSNATAFASNADNISSGTLDTARLPAVVNVSTLVNVGANVNISTEYVALGNATVNTLILSTGVTTGSVVADTLSGNGASVTSVDAATVGGNTASDLRSYADDASDDAYSNATAFAANADNISSGTLSTNRLPATANISTAINVGANVNITTSDVTVGNSTVNTVINATAIAIGTQNITANSEGFNLSGNKVYVSGIAVGNTVVISDGSFDTTQPLNVTNTFSAGNTTVLGFANVTGNMMAGSFNIGANIVANNTSVKVGNGTTNTIITKNSIDIGNSAVNAVINSTALSLSNSSYTASLTPSTLTVTTINATDISGNGAYVTSVDAATVGGNTASTLRIYTDDKAANAYANAIADSSSDATDKAANAYSNATAFASNADNISSGTLNTARLPATANVSTAINVGANVNLTTSSINIGNSTVNTVIIDTGITTGSVVATTLSGDGTSVSNVDAATVGGNTASDLRTYSEDKAANAYANAIADSSSDATDKAANAYSNAVTFASNASNISVGTLNTARLPATANISTAINVGANVNLTTSSINVGNSTVNTVIDSGHVSTTLVELVSGASFGADSLDMANTRIVSLASPINTTDAATKGYVDQLSEGLKAKPAAEVATTASLDATYYNGSGDDGAGATLTATSNGAFPTIDGYTLSSITNGDNGVVVKNQANAAHNGRYNLTQVGNTSAPWILTRCYLCDQSDEIPGTFVFVRHGTLYENTGWLMDVADPDTFAVGTDDISWIQFSGAGSYLAGDYLFLDGTEFNVNASSSSVASVVVVRDASQNFAANTITADLVGTANNANNLGGQAPAYYTNATNISSGTLNTARLPATANVSTAINVGANVNLSTSQISVGNSTVNTVVVSTGITTGNLTASALSGNGASITSVNAATVGGNTASDLRTYADDKAANAYSNAVSTASADATSKAATAYANAVADASSGSTDKAANAYSNAIAYASNASNISSGTLNTARLPATVNVATVINVGANVSMNTSTIKVGNSTSYTAVDRDELFGYGGAFGKIGSVSFVAYSSTNTSLQICDSFAYAEFSAAQYFIQMTNNEGDCHSINISLMHNGTDVFMTQYGELKESASLGTFDAAISGSNVVLRITPTAATTHIHGIRQALGDTRTWLG